MPSSLSTRDGELANLMPLSIIDSFLPGFSILSRFYSSYFGIDITRIFAWLAFLYVSGRTAGYAWDHIKSFFTRFLTCSVTISTTDPLHRNIQQWVSVHVVKENSRFMTAMSTAATGRDVTNDDIMRLRMGKRPKIRAQEFNESPSSVQFYPTFSGDWFFFKCRLLVVQRSRELARNGTYRYFNPIQEEGGDPLVLTTPGLSPEPIKRFIKECEQFAVKSRESLTTIYSVNRIYGASGWDVAISRPSRPLDTVDMDEAIKTMLLDDIQDYLAAESRKFYARRGIPYRRGYLFWGPPGTGKTSISIALAGFLGLELYTLSLSNNHIGDRDLGNLFATLPAKCIVLLEDIDVAGMSREARARKRVQYENAMKDFESKGDDKDFNRLVRDKLEKRRQKHLAEAFSPESSVTLSGLLNAIDGVSSQEGRVLIMTTNDPETLDKALIRPGRVDLQIRFGPISQQNAKAIFSRFYTRDNVDWPTDEHEDKSVLVQSKGQPISADELEQLASDFAKEIPEEKLTPAEVQGYLLTHKTKPRVAVSEVATWVKEVNAAKQSNRNIIKSDPLNELGNSEPSTPTSVTHSSSYLNTSPAPSTSSKPAETTTPQMVPPKESATSTNEDKSEPKPRPLPLSETSKDTA